MSFAARNTQRTQGRFWLLTLLATLVFSAWSEPAMACEAGYCVPETMPADGAVDVPTNARLWVFYNATPGSDPEVTLLEADTGQTVFQTVEYVAGGNEYDEVRNRVAIVEPFGGMAAQTTYRLVLGEGFLCSASAPTVTFTTGASDKASAPNFAGATAVDVSCISAPDELNSCNDGSAFPKLIFSTSAAPANDVAAYRLVRNGETVAVQRELPVTAHLLPQDAAETECFTLQAVNIAGAEDGNNVEVCGNSASAVCLPEGGEDTGMADAGVADVGGEDTGTPDVGGDVGISTDVANNTPDTQTNTPDAETPSAIDGQGDEGCGCGSVDGGRPLDGSLLLVLFGVCVGRLRTRHGPPRT